jgi:hypothetical protein
MATPIKKLTPEVLKQMIIEEAAKLQKEVLEQEVEDPTEVEAEEIDGGDYAVLNNHIDFIKVLKIQEHKLIKQLKAVREAKALVGRKIMGTL